MGHKVLIGRKTYEAIGKPLPGRTNIIISGSWPSGYSLEAACKLVGAAEEGFILGGGTIYHQLLSRASKAYVTWVEASVAGDVFFPVFPTPEWRLEWEEQFPADQHNDYLTTFAVYERKINDEPGC